MNVANGSTGAAPSGSTPARMNDLPIRIHHVADNYVPLGFLLQRLSQKTHNNLQDAVRELARKAVAGMDGSSAPAVQRQGDDGSIDNIEKKKTLLNFARHEHDSWVKALVISEWSKKADRISKLIDLENHMFEEELIKYEQAVNTMINLKRNLGGARLTSPDLKTALHVLSRGNAPWMPTLNFIQPPPLSATDQAKRLDDISTLLALRLNLDDYDTIPYQFRDNYTIESGRVTFRVPHEFEVDLTLASDDFTQQLWFLDLRFLFTPAPADMTPGLRGYLEHQLNIVLEQQGLPGCYRLLHEFTLTHKINELRRQMHELARGRWIETVRIEKLNRAVCVQYWTTQGLNNSRHWFIIGAHSGHDAATADLPEEQVSSRLSLRWFRDGKEVKDAPDSTDHTIRNTLLSAIADNTASEISAEKVLQTMAALHVEHILTGIYKKLAAKPMYAQRHASMRLRICKTDASRSFLDVQLSSPSDRVCVRIDPINGMFSLSPQHTRATVATENRLNATQNNPAAAAAAVQASSSIPEGKDAVTEGMALLEAARCSAAYEELSRRSKTFGWAVVRNGGPGPMNPSNPSGQTLPFARLDDVRQIVNMRDHNQLLWLKRHDWAPNWYVLASLSLAGDRWWLVKVAEQPPPSQTPPAAQRNEFGLRGDGGRILMHMMLPMGSRPTDFNKDFFSDLTIYGTGIMTQYADTLELSRRKRWAKAARAENPYLPGRAKLPAISISLPELLSSSSPSPSSSSSDDSSLPITVGLKTKTPAAQRWWASDQVLLLFRGIDESEALSVATPETARQRRVAVLAEARLFVQDRQKFRLLGTSRSVVDNDVAFNSRTGQFRLYLRAEVGKTVVDTLVSRLRAIERLVGFLDAIRRESRVVHSQSVSLNRLVFSYTVGPGSQPQEVTTEGAIASTRAATSNGRWLVTVDLTHSTQVQLQLEDKCPHLRVADYLGRIANNSATLPTLPFFLTSTLSLHRALDRIEDAWEPIMMRNIGMLNIMPRALDWVTVRMMLATGPAGAAAGATPQQNARTVRQLSINIRLRTRRHEAMWEIRRDDPSASNASNANAAEDDLTKVMRRIFEGSGPGWQGMSAAVIASPYPGKSSEEAPPSVASSAPRGATGIEDCLLQIDEAVRSLQMAAPNLQTARMMQQQQRVQAQTARMV